MELLSSDRIGKLLQHKDNLNIQWWCLTTVMGHDNLHEITEQVQLARTAGLKIVLNVMCLPDDMPQSPWFRNVGSRYSNEGVMSFLTRWYDYCRTMYELVKPDILEVFSEHNCVVSWGAGTIPDDYVLLLRIAREACPSAFIGIGGFTTTVTQNWYHRLIDIHAERYADCVCIHPYTQERDLAAVLKMMDELFYRIYGDGLPIYITEFGLPATGEERKPLSSSVPPFDRAGLWGLSDNETAVWWQQLLELWNKYCQTAACYTRPVEDVAHLFADINYWGLYIGIEGKPSYDIISKWFKGG